MARAAIFNARVLGDSSLGSSAKLLWLWFGLFHTETFRLNVREVAVKMGMSRTTVRRALVALETRHLIRWEEAAGGGAVDRCGVVTILTPPTLPLTKIPVKEKRIREQPITIPPGFVTVKEAMKLIGIRNTGTWARLVRECGIVTRKSERDRRIRLLSVEDVQFMAGTWRSRQKGTGNWTVGKSSTQ